MLRTLLARDIRRNNGNLHTHFSVPGGSVRVREVVKNCRTSGCRSGDCHFSITELRFFCLCSPETRGKTDCVIRNRHVGDVGQYLKTARQQCSKY